MKDAFLYSWLLWGRKREEDETDQPNLGSRAEDFSVCFLQTFPLSSTGETILLYSL